MKAPAISNHRQFLTGTTTRLLTAAVKPARIAATNVIMSLQKDAPSLAVVGVTGAVGQEFLSVLTDRNFPYSSIKMLASKRSAGKHMTFEDRDYVIEELTEESFHGVDIALFSAGGSISKKFGPVAVDSGSIVVDNSSAFRMDENVPLVIPEVNPEALAHIKIRNKKGALIANPNCSTIIYLMAATPLNRTSKKYGDPTLMRFLIARSMNTEKATKMFVEWLKWRSTMVPSGFISEAEVPEHLEAGKVCLQGLSSKNQLPVAVFRASKHYPAKDQPQFKKFLVYMLDKIIASSFKGSEIGNEKLISIIDLQHIAYKNADPRGLITGFQFLQAYYPERLAKGYIVNMPRFFVAIWRMVSRFLDKATLKRIVIVTNEDEKKELIEEIGVDILPEEYGGKAKFIAIHEYVVTPCESSQT